MNDNQNNDIQIRPEVNASKGYSGAHIVRRAPEGGVGPHPLVAAAMTRWPHH